MTDESIKLVVSKLEQLAQNIGVGVEEIYPYVVKQVLIVSYSSYLLLVIFIVCVIGAIVFGKLVTRQEEEPYATLLAICCVMAVVMFVVGVITFFLVGLNFLNPEYHAIVDIIRLIK